MEKVLRKRARAHRSRSPGAMLVSGNVHWLRGSAAKAATYTRIMPSMSAGVHGERRKLPRDFGVVMAMVGWFAGSISKAGEDVVFGMGCVELVKKRCVD